MTVALYGGSFNPIHLGHLEAAEATATQLNADKVIFIPTAQPPHKDIAEQSPDAKMRLEKVKLATENIPKFEVSDFEVNSGEHPNYTVNTIAHFKKIYPNDRLVLMLGADMFLSFETWYKFEEILENAELAVFPRAEGDLEKIEQFAIVVREKYSATVNVISKIPLEMSSSEIRELFANRQGHELVSPEVYRYILKKRLYNVKANLDFLREEAINMLTPSRVPHVLACEEVAIKLAQYWGTDEVEAAEALILHDITKKDGAEQQLILCKEYDIMIDSVERGSHKLLHSKTGAMVAYDKFAISERVRDAIFWHTTAKADMNMLEKIAYVADYIESTRDFEGVEELRKLAFENIDDAMVLGLEMSIDDIVSRGIAPHPNSQEALNWYKSLRER